MATVRRNPNFFIYIDLNVRQIYLLFFLQRDYSKVLETISDFKS